MAPHAKTLSTVMLGCKVQVVSLGHLQQQGPELAGDAREEAAGGLAWRGQGTLGRWGFEATRQLLLDCACWDSLCVPVSN